MNSSKPLLVCFLAAVAWLPAQACYTVYDAAGRVAYRSMEAPVDMSRPLHETLPQRFPGGQLVFDVASTCKSVDTVAPARSAAAGTAAPLLTDRRTAEAMGVDYAPLSSRIVMVPPQDAAIVLAGAAPVNVIAPAVQAPVLAQSPVRPATSAMGAAPDTARMGGPARGTVITEWRDPPVTIVESPEGVTATVRSR